MVASPLPWGIDVLWAHRGLTLGTSDVVTAYNERDVALYALTVGAAEDPLDSDDLPLVYELTDEFRVLPTFAVVFPFAGMAAITEVRI